MYSTRYGTRYFLNHDAAIERRKTRNNYYFDGMEGVRYRPNETAFVGNPVLSADEILALIKALPTPKEPQDTEE